MNEASEIKKYIRKIRRERSFKNSVIDGIEKIEKEKIERSFRVTPGAALVLRVNQEIREIEEIRKVNIKTGEPGHIVAKNEIKKEIKWIEFPLTEVTPEKILEYRKKGVPSFVLKIDGKLYYSEINKRMNFLKTNFFGEPHQCAIIGAECKRLSPASDENGGCAKVRALVRYIEKYDWIRTGFETFNTSYDNFKVADCEHYVKSPNKKRSKIVLKDME